MEETLVIDNSTDRSGSTTSVYDMQYFCVAVFR